MTEDFKKELLNYITNSIQPTPSNDTQILEKTENIPRDEFTDFIPATFTSFRASNIIQSETNGYFIVYGGYVPTGETATTDSRGFIMILNEELKPIKTIYEFDSGTKLRPIQKMIQIEDGTFVGVDSTIYAIPENRADIQNNEKRFIMLNNFSIKDEVGDYSVKLRISYKIPTSYQNFFCIDMIKNPNSAHYLLAGATYVPKSGGSHYDGVRVIDLKVNVGESNEWSAKTTDTNNYWLYGGFFGEFNSEDTATYKVILTHNTSPTAMGFWNGTNYTEIMTTSGGVQPYVDSIAMRNQAVFINYDTVYFVINNQRWGSEVKARYVGLYKYTFSNSTLKQIFLKYVGDYDWNGSKEGIFLNALNGELYINYCDNCDIDNSTANYNYQRLENDEWNPILIYENKNYFMERMLNYTFNIYNLVKNVIIYAGMSTNRWSLQLIKEIYNNLNYNGLPYKDYKSLIAHSGTIYSNNDLVFARNLYNVTTLNNTTMATIQIPNGMLNNINIDNKNLLGETNLKLVQDNNVITKNIYETVFLNFINTINVIDEDTNTRFPDSATYINDNINIGTQANCEDTAIGKVRINYADNTTKVFSINWTKINPYNKITYYSLYVDKSIDNIEYISNDESTVYCRRQIELDIGSIYTISQKIRTGKKVTAIQLQYNNEDINYNSEPVMAYVEE